jgi:hypothetical protein
MARRRSGRRNSDESIAWCGTLVSIQPRVHILRSFTEERRSFLGFLLWIEGTIGDESRSFTVAIGKGTHQRYRLRSGDTLRGAGTPFVAAAALRDAGADPTEFLQLGGLEVTARRDDGNPAAPPPWLDAPPEAAVYDRRRPQTIDGYLFDLYCARCIWGCRIAAEIVLDRWDESLRRHRQELVCFGPHECPYR